MAEDLPDDIRVPTLATQVQGEAPDVLGHTNYILIDQPAPNEASFDGWERPVQESLAVATGSIRDAENQLIWKARYNIPHYEEFKRKILSEESWGFLVDDPKHMEPYYHEDVSPGLLGDPYADESGTYADFTDPDPAATQEQIDVNHALLRAIGDSYAQIGTFIAMLNDAAQLYCLADLNSKPPNNAVPID